MTKAKKGIGIQTCEPIRTKKEIALIKNYLKGKNLRDYTLFVTGINSSLRIGDILKLKWKDAFDENGNVKKEIRIIEEKTNKMKIFATNINITEALSAFYRECGRPDLDNYIFQSRNGVNKPLSYKMVWVIFQDIKNSLRLSFQFGSHSMRKTFAYHAWQSGVPIEKLMEVLNQSSVAVTRRYIGITQTMINNIYLDINL